MSTPTATKKRTFRSKQVCAWTGITYRQVDYWARIGVLVPSCIEAAGSGSSRQYSVEDMHLASLARDLFVFRIGSTAVLKVLRTVKSLMEQTENFHAWLVIDLEGNVKSCTGGEEIAAALVGNSGVVLYFDAGAEIDL